MILLNKLYYLQVERVFVCLQIKFRVCNSNISVDIKGYSGPKIGIAMYKNRTKEFSTMAFLYFFL